MGPMTEEDLELSRWLADRFPEGRAARWLETLAQRDARIRELDEEIATLKQQVKDSDALAVRAQGHLEERSRELEARAARAEEACSLQTNALANDLRFERERLRLADLLAAKQRAEIVHLKAELAGRRDHGDQVT